MFIDSERASWNMDPALLREDARRRGRGRDGCRRRSSWSHLYGQSADLDPILAACDALRRPADRGCRRGAGRDVQGARRRARSARVGVFSFNGNKIITTSGGGMLVSDDEALDRARAQAGHAGARSGAALPALRDRLQLPPQQRARGHRARPAAGARGPRRGAAANFDFYVRALGDVPGIAFMPEAPWGRHTRWLTTLTIDPAEFGADREAVRLALRAENIEARPVWKPMHLQPVFADCAHVGGGGRGGLFEQGLSLPSGSDLTDDDLARIVGVIRRCVR